MTPDELRNYFPNAGSRATIFAPLLTETADKFGILPGKRMAAWLAQIAIESGSLVYTKEIADGSAYEGRQDLGNIQPGDGVRYKGRGLLQITGRANYRLCGTNLGLDLIATPETLEEPKYAALSAGWFWSTRGLNALADVDQFGAITKRINGGYTHLDERIGYWLRIRKLMGL